MTDSSEFGEQATTGDTTPTGQDAGDAQQPTDTGEQDTSTPDTQSEAPMSRDEITKLVTDTGQRIADRQVNALMKELRGNKRGQKQDSATDTDDSGGGQRERGTSDRYDEREARMAYREYLSDRHTFVDSSERELATTLGTTLVATGLAEHGDPDRAGRDAAEQVSTQLGAYRKAVEQAQITSLRKRGALVTEPGRGGDSPPSGQAPQPSTTADLRSSARSMAQQFNTELGHPKAG